MATRIVTKFTIGTEQGIDTLLFITAAAAREKFVGKVPEQELERYINENFNRQVLMTELNSMSNQYLVVYADDEPAGYARVTSKGVRPDFFDGKTLVRIADFAVLAKYSDPLIKQSLFEKCISISNMQQVVWISEFEGSSYLDFFEGYGFKITPEIKTPPEFSLTPVNLIKEKG